MGLSIRNFFVNDYKKLDKISLYLKYIEKSFDNIKSI
jgi:hypothetical protein